MNKTSEQPTPAVRSTGMLDGVVCHVVCTNPKAHAELSALCQKWRGGDAMWIDWEQSKYSYDVEQGWTKPSNMKITQ